MLRGNTLNRLMMRSISNIALEPKRIDRNTLTLRLPMNGFELKRDAEAIDISMHLERPLASFNQDLKDSIIKTRRDPVSVEIYHAKEKNVRLASSTLLLDVIEQGFELRVDGRPFQIAKMSRSELLHLPMYEKQLEELKTQWKELNKRKQTCDKQAMKTTRSIIYAGYVALCAQMGLMARLTWWEYSWDVTEPIAAFLTLGTGCIGYFFFALTRREYTFNDMTFVTASRLQWLLYNRKIKNSTGETIPMVDIQSWSQLTGQINAYERALTLARDPLVDIRDAIRALYELPKSNIKIES